MIRKREADRGKRAGPRLAVEDELGGSGLGLGEHDREQDQDADRADVDEHLGSGDDRPRRRGRRCRPVRRSAASSPGQNGRCCGRARRRSRRRAGCPASSRKSRSSHAQLRNGTIGGSARSANSAGWRHQWRRARPWRWPLPCAVAVAVMTVTVVAVAVAGTLGGSSGSIRPASMKRPCASAALEPSRARCGSS